MAPGHLQGALASPCARHLSIDTRGPRVSTNFQKINFLKDVAFPKKRGVLSSSRPTTPTSRPVRHDAVGVFLRHPPASSPPCLPLQFPSRTTEVTRDPRSREPDDGARRDFACTSTWPHDGALPKHGAPRTATAAWWTSPASRPNFGSSILPKLPTKNDETYQRYQNYQNSPSFLFSPNARNPLAFRVLEKALSSVCVAL